MTIQPLPRSQALVLFQPVVSFIDDPVLYGEAIAESHSRIKLFRKEDMTGKSELDLLIHEAMIAAQPITPEEVQGYWECVSLRLDENEAGSC